MSDKKPITLMIVDDSKIMRDLIAGAAARMGCFKQVKNAADGVDAITFFKLTNPQVVTMDITMPKQDGIETIKQMREINPNVRILVISSLTDRNTAMDAIDAGASAFLDKPFSDEHFIARAELLTKGLR